MEAKDLLKEMVLDGEGQAEFERKVFEAERSKKFPPAAEPKMPGKVAIVTGAAGGQGELEAKVIAQQGAKVCAIDIKEDELARVVKNINDDGNEAMYIVMDVSDEQAWQDAVKQVVDKWGRIDYLVNNAGVLDGGNVLNEPTDSFKKLLDIDLFGVFFGMKYCGPEMAKVGGGAIVNTSSIYGAHFGPANCVAYATAKAAVVGLSRAAANDLAEYGIRVNTVHPGHILTPMTYARPANRAKLADATLQKRFGLSEELARPVLFLLSDDASHITGQCLYVDGGMTIYLNTNNKAYGTSIK